MRLLTIFPLLLPLLAAAQIGRKELHTDTGTVVLHYFKGGGVSTREWMDKDQRWGRSTAYTRDGRVLFEHQTRRIAGHATVHFSYHPNGGISKAEVSEAPDAGIQWYRSTTTFNEAGERTGFTEQGHDNYGPIPSVTVPTTERVPPPVQEIVVEQRLFVNEVFVVNPTRYACRVQATPKAPSPALPGGSYTMAPGDTLRIGSYTMGEVFAPWPDHLSLHISQAVLKHKRTAVATTCTDQVQADPERRRYYVVIEGWTKAGKEPKAEGGKRKRWGVW